MEESVENGYTRGWEDRTTEIPASTRQSTGLRAGEEMDRAMWRRVGRPSVLLVTPDEGKGKEKEKLMIQSCNICKHVEQWKVEEMWNKSRTGGWSGMGM